MHTFSPLVSILVHFYKQFGPDQDCQNVGPDLDPHWLKFWRYILKNTLILKNKRVKITLNQSHFTVTALSSVQCVEDV